MLPPLLPLTDIRNIEQSALARLAPHTLMYRAGLATAKLAMQLVSDTSAPILVVAGTGNNGGDAFETAYQLAQHHYNVTILCHAAQLDSIVDVGHPVHRVRTTAAKFIDIDQSTATVAQTWSLIIDGLFGIGLQRPITGYLSTLVHAINRHTCPILAIDVPSGIDADTGIVVGNSEGAAIHATHTITFIADKPGLHTCDGVDYSGHITVNTLNIEEVSKLPSLCALNTEACFTEAFIPRRRNSHKGNFGDLIIIGGAQGMVGAPILSARAGLHAGAGKTFVAFAGQAPDYDHSHPELMFRQATTIEFDRAVIVTGPGLGISDEAQQLVHRVLSTQNMLVLDADALNLIAKNALLQQLLRSRNPDTTIITPHPLEAARLLGCTATEVQNDRLTAAKKLARLFKVVAVVKGAGTIIATTSEQTFINTTGNPALSTGGTGDVLAGLCGALVAQKIPVDKAALAAVWIHGRAADNLVAHGIGPIGLTASELTIEIRNVINTLTKKSQ